MEVSGAVHSDGLGIAYGTTDRERRGSALPVTRTRPRTTTGEREILGDEIAGRDEKGHSIVLVLRTVLPANVNVN
jgi:hypothetical protein